MTARPSDEKPPKEYELILDEHTDTASLVVSEWHSDSTNVLLTFVEIVELTNRVAAALRAAHRAALADAAKVAEQHAESDPQDCHNCPEVIAAAILAMAAFGPWLKGERAEVIELTPAVEAALAAVASVKSAIVYWEHDIRYKAPEQVDGLYVQQLLNNIKRALSGDGRGGAKREEEK